MRKVVITFGLICGLIIGVMVWINTSLLCDGELISFDYAMWIGYASMLIALTMVFFGIKSYRDNYAGGRITFWKCVQIGALISLIGAVMYFAGAMAYTLSHPGWEERFTEKYTQHMVEKMRTSGAPQVEIDNTIEEAKSMQAMLQNPLIFFLVCLMEFLPVGIIVTLVSSLLLRRREMLPATS